MLNYPAFLRLDRRLMGVDHHRDYANPSAALTGHSRTATRLEDSLMSEDPRDASRCASVIQKPQSTKKISVRVLATLPFAQVSGRRATDG